MRNEARAFIKSLQDQITTALNQINGESYQEDQWDRDGGGGGITRVYSGGSFLEKGGVNFSEVYGEFSPEFAEKMPHGSGLKFYATGVSLVLHPKNPFAPTVHANYRYIERGEAGWFGGGADLTPCYVFVEDAQHFHRIHKEALDPFGKYPEFKKNCDEYFYLPHRKET
ncbi:MAG: coproporphyrinogen III oxidase, partial [Bdellovibrionales bacterium]|nr:coproporphyrinogen III oxidase [Bdellovibrionales bacterium]